MEALRGRVAVVTGAASGIGLALAERLAAEGMKVVLADVDAAGLERAAARTGGLAVRTDVTSAADVEALASTTFERFGAAHVVCHNAGVTHHTGQAVWELGEADWRWLLGVNFDGVVNGLRSFVPRMIASGEEGHLVVTASLAGLVAGAGPYGATKHAVVSLCESLAIDLEGRGAPIGVTCLCPGLVATNIVENRRAGGPPEEPAHAAYRARIADKTRQKGRAPADVAAVVVDAIRTRTFYAFTDPPAAVDDAVRSRLDAILARGLPKAKLPS